MLSQGPFSHNRFDELDRKFPGIVEEKESVCNKCKKSKSKKSKSHCMCDKEERWQDSDGDGKWYEPGEDVAEEYIEEKKKGRCWTGYKPTPGKEPYSPGSCQKEEVIAFLMGEGYANNEVSAEVLYNHMSNEWLQAINEAITE